MTYSTIPDPLDALRTAIRADLTALAASLKWAGELLTAADADARQLAAVLCAIGHLQDGVDALVGKLETLAGLDLEDELPGE